jgi:isoamylase
VANLSTERGRPLPLGATSYHGGVNFVVPTRNGTAVTLVLSPADDNKPFAEIALDPFAHRTGHHWHIAVIGLPAAFRYGWRVDGPSGPLDRYDPSIILLDPASTLVSGAGTWGKDVDRNLHPTRRSLYTEIKRYDWETDRLPLTPPEDSILYEMHVRGFSQHKSSNVRQAGTFAGLIEKLPYLTELGVTALELLPIHEFDECECKFINPQTGKKNLNYWGYNSIAFNSPKASFASSGPADGQADEFRDMVKACHAAGVEVILDVVFNHTGEGDATGRTYSFRGLDNSLYYMLAPDGSYRNFSGTGNTLNCNHPVVRELIMDSLHYWVGRMNVDGFRFDLASVLGRDQQGRVLLEPPTVESIVEDPLLADTKLIAEPWDAAGLFQVGEFPFGRRWAEWNGHYRDDVRRFWRGDPGTVNAFATRLCGSADLYQTNNRKPIHSINFITCHDGFTLWDLVSYNQKHNEANGENNRDGSDANWSSNHGVEGPTNDPAINELRQRQAKNLMATLFLSQGVPMLMAGDEFLRTQHGNNNAWCQDNEISWLDWSLAKENAGFLRFVREMIHFRRRHPALRRRTFLRGVDSDLKLGPADATWHGTEPNKPNFSHDSHAIGLLLDGKQTGREGDCDFFMFFNSGDSDVEVRLPKSHNGGDWRMVINTALPSSEDLLDDTTDKKMKRNTTVQITHKSLVVAITGEY